MKNKKNFWEKHISAWENNGLSQAEYCRKYGISVKTFGYHKRRMAAAAMPPKVIPVPQTVLPTESKSRISKPINLYVPGGFRIEIEPDFCQITLKRMLEVVSNASV